MPHILVSSKPNFSPFSAGPSGWPRLAALLQVLGVRHLTVRGQGGGDLEEDDIDVTFAEPGPYDRQKKDVVITITANHFDGRAQSRAKRLKGIKKDLVESDVFHRDITVGIWLLLPTAAWVEL